MNRIVQFFGDDLKACGEFEFASRFNRYVGDIHNHCGISYGYGTLENAITFARTQLDFFSVTGHFAWPDIEASDSMCVPQEVVAYHREGFARLRRNWPEYKVLMQHAQTQDFIPFSSYEFHSFYYGDYTIVCKELSEALPDEVPIGSPDVRLQKLLEGDERQTDRFLCIPHHIGYRKGYRGINFDEFNEQVSPLVEIISMHGCAESPQARITYCHTMGPRCSENTYQGGLKRGYHFGVTGSTDHHNAAPGSYGAGRTVLWSEELTRDAVWHSLQERRTSAASGDPMEVMLFVNDAFQGQKTKKLKTTQVRAYVVGFDKLDSVELVQGDTILAGQYDFPSDESYSGCVDFMFGWGKKHVRTSWDIQVDIIDGVLLDVSPRLRGIDMVDPLDTPENAGDSLPRFTRSEHGACFRIVTDGNSNAVTDSSQGFVLDIEGNERTKVKLQFRACWGDIVENRTLIFSIDDLRHRSTSEYVHGFVSPAVAIGRFCARGEVICKIERDFQLSSFQAVYLRAYQQNGDCVFSSPVSFVE